jgi:hypothetical protein
MMKRQILATQDVYVPVKWRQTLPQCLPTWYKLGSIDLRLLPPQADDLGAVSLA